MKTSSSRALALFVLASIAAVAVAAGCGGGGYGATAANYGGGNPPPPPSPTPGPVIHINFLGNGNGSIMTPPFGVVSGYTQQAHAQVMAFAPGEQIVVTNNDTTAHTINVFSAYPTPGPQSTASVPNGGVFGPGYQSGLLQPGQSTSTLMVTNTPGNLFVLCGIHFSVGMQDGIIVQVGATPGPQATPVPGGGGCHGYGC